MANMTPQLYRSYLYAHYYGIREGELPGAMLQDAFSVKDQADPFVTTVISLGFFHGKSKQHPFSMSELNKLAQEQLR